jgi:hypothetical protein
MDAHLKVETGSFVPRGVKAGCAPGEEGAVSETAAQGEERERRRIEFRKSLVRARNQALASRMEVDGGMRTHACVRQAGAERRQPGVLRMELVRAR